MITDQPLSRLLSMREARDPATDLLIRAWTGADPADRAAMLVAEDDPARAGVVGGAPFDLLAQGNVPGVLEHVRNATRVSPALRVAEAEALLAAGAIQSGLECLQTLHRNAYAPATLALARRTLQLGDEANASRIAAHLPRHVHAMMVRVRADLAIGHTADAMLGLEPFLEGTLPTTPGTAAGIAALSAAVLAKGGGKKKLVAFARELLNAKGLPSTMLPGVARAAWTAGLGAEAWRRMMTSEGDEPFAAAARIELALLSGEAVLAEKAAEEAGILGAASGEARELLSGRFKHNEHIAATLRRSDRTVHVWRTAGERYAAWLRRMPELGARIEVCDLKKGKLPKSEEVPDLAIDDGALPALIDPSQVPMKAKAAAPVYIHPKLCQGVALGLDLSADVVGGEELGMKRTATPDRAGIVVAPADEALELGAAGKACVAIAIPGDPYWMGPLPERSFGSLRVLRAHRVDGWKNAAKELGSALQALLGAPEDSRT